MIVRCPHEGCGQQMWEYDPYLLTCKRGHRMAKDAVIPPAPSMSRPTHIVVPVPKWWQHPEVPWVLVGVAVLAQIVEVLL